MIDTKELRRLAQAASPGPWIAAGPSFGESLPKYLNEVVIDREGDEDDGYSICGAPLGLDKEGSDDMAFVAAANPATITELLDRLEAAESDALEQARLNGMGASREAALMAKLEAAEKERDELRAEIAAMKRQEPAMWVNSVSVAEQDQINAEAAIRSIYGAQPAPSIPEGWKPIPEKHPTFDLVDLRLADGSVLCGCVPQSDGDYWWNGPSGEVFIDPKYAPVTHWRLYALPGAKGEKK
jgi:hypothetical protein